MLVLSGPDPTATAVESELARHPVQVVRLDLGDFPARGTLSAHTTADGRWAGRLRTADGEIEWQRVRSVYYRRPSRFTFDPGLSPSDRLLAEYEARLGLGGVLAGLDCPWIGDPTRVARAEYKPCSWLRCAGPDFRCPQPSSRTTMPRHARGPPDSAAQ